MKNRIIRDDSLLYKPGYNLQIDFDTIVSLQYIQSQSTSFCILSI